MKLRLPELPPKVRPKLYAGVARRARLDGKFVRGEEVDMVGVVPRLGMVNVRGHGEEESPRPKGPADLFQNQAFLLQGDVLEHVMGQRGAERCVSKWQRLGDVASDNRKSPSGRRPYAFPRELNADCRD